MLIVLGKQIQSISRLFRQFIIRDLLKNRLRFILTILGIALGVSVLLAINLANHTVNAQFNQTVDLISGKSNLEIRPVTDDYIDENLLKTIDWIWIFGGKYTPLIEKYVVLPGPQEDTVQFLGIDMLCDPDFRTYVSEESRGNNLTILDPNNVFIGAKLASKYHLSEGQNFDILVDDLQKKLTIAQVLPPTGLGGAYSGNLIVGDIACAQEKLSLKGKISAVELIIPSQFLKDTSKKLIEELPKTLNVISPSQRAGQLEKLSRSFEYNLLALSFVALMVGMFLIYNTMTITVLRRRNEIGILRALGTSRLRIAIIFSMEILLLGSLGSALGVAGGLLLANSALELISKTIQYFYYQEPVSLLNIDPAVLILTFWGGILITFVSALPPLIEAIKVQPAEAVRRGSQTVHVFRWAKSFAFTGLILYLFAYYASMQSAFDHFPVFGYVAALLSILGLALCLPLVLKLVLPWLARLMGRFNWAEGKLAALSLYGTLDRTAVAVASLMIGIAMMVSLAIMIGSFRNTVNTWINQTLKADLWVQSEARASGSSNSRLSNSVVEEIRKTPGVEVVDSFVEIPIIYGGEQSNLAAAEFSVIKRYGHLRFISGESCQTVCARLKENSALISETFAIRRNIKQGDFIIIETPSGPFNFEVTGIYYDYASDLGYILIDRSLFMHLFKNSDISSCAIYLKAKSDSDAVRMNILNTLRGKYSIVISSTGELRTEAMKIFDRTFSITYALHTIATTVAILAVMNALFALTMESKREFGILRYVGARSEQIRNIVLFQAGLLGIFGILAGLTLGFVLSVLLIYVINRQSFGWTIEVCIPYAFLLESSVIIFLTAILSGLLPAHFAAKTLAPDVVRDE